MNTPMFFIKFFAYLARTLPEVNRLTKEKKADDTREVREKIHNRIMAWGKKFIAATNSTVTVYGEENLDGIDTALFVVNHQSYFDIPLLLGYVDKEMGFIAKEELAKVPILSKWMRLIDCVFIKRGDTRASIQAIYNAEKQLKEGYSMVIFPEGTRSKDGKIHRFRQGCVKLALGAKVPIIPISIDGAWEMYEKNKKFCASDVTINIGKPIYYEDIPKSEITNEANKLQLVVEELRNEKH